MHLLKYRSMEAVPDVVLFISFFPFAPATLDARGGDRGGEQGLEVTPVYPGGQDSIT
jgi:hypothetical protein